MIEPGKTYLVMGLLDTQSIAWTIGQTLTRFGGRVVYSMQSEVLRRRYLDPSLESANSPPEALDIRYCDVTIEEQVRALFDGLGPLAGVVHSLAYANPRTCLGREFHTEAIGDIQKSYHVTCVSLATVARYTAAHMPAGGALVTLSFDTRHAYPLYNWMGVHKAALEALVRALARRHGRDGIRVNAVSAGPLATAASQRIPEFGTLLSVWQHRSPLPWDPVRDKQAVADAVAFLLSPLAQRITGQILAVDGGASIIGGELLEHERPEGGVP